MADNEITHEDILIHFKNDKVYEELVQQIYPVIRLLFKFFSQQVQSDLSFRRVMLGKISTALEELYMSDSVPKSCSVETLEPAK